MRWIVTVCVVAHCFCTPAEGGIALPHDTVVTLRKQELVGALARQLPRDFVENVFGDGRLRIDTTIFSPGLEQNFHYLMRDSVVRRGRKYLRERHTLLDSVAHAFKVSPEVLTALFVVESDLGRVVDPFSVVNVFFTRYVYAKDGKQRKEIVKQLTCFLSLCREEGWDPYSVRGSRWGALGLPQFMPCSFAYSWDGDRNGRVDLFQSEADALFSIGNFLWNHGSWRPNGLAGAVFAYNHSQEYVAAVLRYAKAIKPRGR